MPETHASRPVLLIGAGLSGLALGRLLTNNGISNVVFESSLSERKQGFAISLHDWGYSPLLEVLGEVSLQSLTKAAAPDRSIWGSGTELAEAMAKQTSVDRAVEAYYEVAARRCQEAVRRSRSRFYVLHRPISEWRDIAEKRRIKALENRQTELANQY
ncbi:FAD-dependent monooxygenase nscC [Penicillium oxalicum]|uniref:FAD-dependent monooxygenase nscC n=1 Tax=Penicillium oxalicum TaxID=69781 RepID=UPI0020B89086|nr:FAD-dependent monooxygenase nscC [Penicillium oxalicum]KAI2785669.1 FAD-dependent monooxygenase nscC [Penicillium oxalicum]